MNHIEKQGLDDIVTVMTKCYAITIQVMCNGVECASFAIDCRGCNVNYSRVSFL